MALIAATLHAQDATSSAPPVLRDHDTGLTADDLTAIDKIDSSEFKPGQAYGSYSEEVVENFLNQFVGTWQGTYKIATMRGDVLTRMEAQANYEWDLVDKTRVLKNQSVYASGDVIGYSSSVTYFWEGYLVTEVEQDDKKRIFLGIISEDGKSVNWSIAFATNKLSSSTRESFTTVDGQPAIKVEAYEEIRNGQQAAMIAMNGQLIKDDR